MTYTAVGVYRDIDTGSCILVTERIEACSSSEALEMAVDKFSNRLTFTHRLDDMVLFRGNPAITSMRRVDSAGDEYSVFNEEETASRGFDSLLAA